MQGWFLFFLSTILFVSGCNSAPSSSKTEGQATPSDSTTLATPTPLILDNMHYYVQDRVATRRFFQENFQAQVAQQQAPALKFMDFLILNPEQGTINISGRGPFEGIAVGDLSKWEKEIVKPAPDLPPTYGVYWIALKTRDLDKAIQSLKAHQVEFISEDFPLPSEPNVPAAMLWTPDYERIVMIERSAYEGKTPYALDHLLLLVSDLNLHQSFFQDIFQAEVISQKNQFTHLKIADFDLHLAEPNGIGLDEQTVKFREKDKFYFGIDRFVFLYEDIKPAYEAAQAKGYKFLFPPMGMEYFEESTPYEFTIFYTPDQFQLEMTSEQGRSGPRAVAVD